MDANGKMSSNACVSCGAGGSLVPIPYFEVKAGYTAETQKFTVKQLTKWAKGKSKKYSKGGMKVTVKRYNKYIKLSSNKIKKSFYAYPATGNKKIKKVVVKK